MEICDSEKQDRLFSHASSSKFIDEISEFSQEFVQTGEDGSKKFKWIGAVILLSAIVGGSSIGPIFNMYGDVNPFLKNLWRCQLNIAIVLPYVLYTLKKSPEAIDSKIFLKCFIVSSTGIYNVLISGVLFTGAIVTFIASAWLTIASHTYILHSLSGVIIIIYKLIARMDVHILEKIGSFAVVIGTVFLMCDPNVQKTGDQETSIFGEILALLCACIFALFLPCNKALLSKMPALVILVFNSFISLICSAIILLLFCNSDLSKLISFDPHEGIFGLFSNEQILVTFLLGPFSILSLGGYALALNYFQPHIIGNAFVAEPFLGQVLGCTTNQDKVPGILTFIGGFIVLPSVLIVAKGSHELVKSNKN